MHAYLALSAALAALLSTTLGAPVDCNDVARRAAENKYVSHIMHLPCCPPDLKQS